MKTSSGGKASSPAIVLTQNPANVRAALHAAGTAVIPIRSFDLETQPIPAPRPSPMRRRLARLPRFHAARPLNHATDAVLRAAKAWPRCSNREPGAAITAPLVVSARTPIAMRRNRLYPPQVVVATEQYNRLARLLARNQPVTTRAERPEPVHRRHARLVQHPRRDPGHGSGR